MSGQRLDPLRLDLRDGAGEQPRRLHQLGGHHPAGVLLRQRRAREDHEMGAAGAEVLAGLALAQADLGEQAGKHGDVDLVGRRVGVVRGEARVARGLAQLRVQVLPFADAQEVQELGAQLLAEPAARQGFPALGDVPPQVEVAQEIRAVGGEAGVLLVGGLALFDGPLARVLHRQRGRDHQHLAQAAGAVGLDEHAAEAGVDREAWTGPGRWGSARCRRARPARAGARGRRSPRGRRAGRRTGTRRSRRGRARSSAARPRRGWCAGSPGR